MKKLLSPILCLMVLLNVPSIFAFDNPESAKDILIRSYIKGNIGFAIKNSYVSSSIDNLVNREIGQIDTKPGHTKSVAKAVLFSSVIPGAGQIYTRSYIKGIVFLIIEAASLSGYIHYQNRGNDLETEFELYADQNWNEDVYWAWVNDECNSDPNWSGPCSSDPLTERGPLREYESWRSDFTHSLPEEQNQQYYENIGKYDQFNIGWKDTNTGKARDSELREQYTLMRKDANDQFKRATKLITIVLFNHVASALDASFTTKRFNRKVKANLNMKSMIYGYDIIPVLTLGVKW